eukprot:2587591-Pleurochrysis_carterae.AAC.1
MVAPDGAGAQAATGTAAGDGGAASQYRRDWQSTHPRFAARLVDRDGGAKGGSWDGGAVRGRSVRAAAAVRRQDAADVGATRDGGGGGNNGGSSVAFGARAELRRRGVGGDNLEQQEQRLPPCGRYESSPLRRGKIQVGPEAILAADVELAPAVKSLGGQPPNLEERRV